MRLATAVICALLFACKPIEPKGNVKGFGDDKLKVTGVKGKEKEFIECIESITQNQEYTLRETHNDPNSKLTEANNINAFTWYDTVRAKYVMRDSAMEFRLVENDYRDIYNTYSRDSYFVYLNTYQNIIFSDIKACQCMKDDGMTIGFKGGHNNRNVRIGLGKLAKSAPSDRYTLHNVKQVLVQLLPDNENVNSHTYHYCRLKVTGHDLVHPKMTVKNTAKELKSFYKNLLSKGELEIDEEARPKMDVKLIDGFTTADGYMRDQVTPLSQAPTTQMRPSSGVNVIKVD